jgi:hypothetical protein
MNSKKAKQLRRLAKQMCMDLKKPIHEILPQYGKLKKIYKESKGQK